MQLLGILNSAGRILSLWPALRKEKNCNICATLDRGLFRAKTVSCDKLSPIVWRLLWGGQMSIRVSNNHQSLFTCLFSLIYTLGSLRWQTPLFGCLTTVNNTNWRTFNWRCLEKAHLPEWVGRHSTAHSHCSITDAGARNIGNVVILDDACLPGWPWTPVCGYWLKLLMPSLWKHVACYLGCANILSCILFSIFVIKDKFHIFILVFSWGNIITHYLALVACKLLFLL